MNVLDVDEDPYAVAVDYIYRNVSTQTGVGRQKTDLTIGQLLDKVRVSTSLTKYTKFDANMRILAL